MVYKLFSIVGISFFFFFRGFLFLLNCLCKLSAQNFKFFFFYYYSFFSKYISFLYILYFFIRVMIQIILFQIRRMNIEDETLFLLTKILFYFISFIQFLFEFIIFPICTLFWSIFDFFLIIINFIINYYFQKCRPPNVNQK